MEINPTLTLVQVYNCIFQDFGPFFSAQELFKNFQFHKLCSVGLYSTWQFSESECKKP